MDRDEQHEHDYDVCLSFAGEDRHYVAVVADALRTAGVRVFYDEYETVSLWGKDLYEHLDDVYRNAARYCVLFVSKHYAEKVWTNHERQSAQARALNENSEYVLPARFDDTNLPGLRPTVAYQDLTSLDPAGLAELIIAKLGHRVRRNFLPPEPDILFEAVHDMAHELQIRGRATETDDEVIYSRARHFLDVLRRMDADERAIVTKVIELGCIAELPENLHVNIDLLRRHTGWTRTKILRVLGRVGSLGFSCSTRTDDHHGDGLGAPAELVVLTWHLLVSGAAGGNGTVVIHQMIRRAKVGYCDECAVAAIERLDFSQLASATETSEEHVLTESAS